MDIIAFPAQHNFQEFQLDFLRRRVTVGPLTLALTSRELALFYTLLEAAGKAVDRLCLCDVGDLSCDDRSLHNHIHRLRKKLRGCGYTIEPVRGTGYRLVREAALMHQSD